MKTVRSADPEIEHQLPADGVVGRSAPAGPAVLPAAAAAVQPAAAPEAAAAVRKPSPSPK